MRKHLATCSLPLGSSSHRWCQRFQLILHQGIAWGWMDGPFRPKCYTILQGDYLKNGISRICSQSDIHGGCSDHWVHQEWNSRSDLAYRFDWEVSRWWIICLCLILFRHFQWCGRRMRISWSCDQCHIHSSKQWLAVQLYRSHTIRPSRRQVVLSTRCSSTCQELLCKAQLAPLA